MKNIAIILNYNDVETTLRLAQKLSLFDVLDLVLIVDNASTDDSQLVLSKVSSSKIEVIFSPLNSGYAQGNNLGLHYAEKHYHPEFFMIANPDIDIDEKTLNHCLDYLKNSNESVACVSPTMKLPKGKMNTAWKLPNYRMMFMMAMIPLRSCLNSLIAYPSSALKSESTQVDVLAGSLFFAKASALEKIAYFDERTFLFGEENILAYKLKQAGYHNVLLNHLEYQHLHSFSINKKFTQIKDKFKMAYQSDLIYLKEYLKVSKLQLTAYQFQYNLWLMIFLGLKQIQRCIIFLRKTIGRLI